MKKIILLSSFAVVIVAVIGAASYFWWQNNQKMPNITPSTSIKETPKIESSVEIPTEVNSQESLMKEIESLQLESEQLRKLADQYAGSAEAKALPADTHTSSWQNHSYFFDASNQLKKQFYADSTTNVDPLQLPTPKIDTQKLAYQFQILKQSGYKQAFPEASSSDCTIQCILLNGHILEKNLTILKTSHLREVGHFIYQDKSIHIIDYRHHRDAYHGGIGILSIKANQVQFEAFSGFRKAKGQTLYRIKNKGLEIKMEDGTYQSIIRFDQKGYNLTELTPYKLVMEICSENEKGVEICEMS